MTINKLVKELCKREGLKKQVDIAQIKEIVGHLAEILCDGEEGCELSNALFQLGEKRAKKRKKK